MRSILVARPIVWLAGFASSVLGCSAGAGSGTTGPTSNPGTGAGPSVTVTGTLVDNCSVPMPNMTVWIRGQGTTLTDNSGSFVFDNVVPPYDIGYVAAPGTPQSLNVVRIFQGVTRTTVRLPFPEYGAVKAGDITGTLSGSDVLFPSPLPRISQIFFTAPGDLGTSHQLVDAAYLIQPTWCGPPSESGTVFALQWTPGSGGSIVYHGFGRLDNVTAQSDGLLPGQDIVMTSLTTGTLAGTTAVPSGYSMASKTFGLAANLTTILPALQADNSKDPAFSFVAPNIPGTTLTLEVKATSGGRVTLGRQQGLSPGQSGISVPLRPAPGLDAPAANATDLALATQPFQWAPFGGGLHVLLVGLSVPSRSTQLTYEVLTAADSAQLVPPADLGVPFVPPVAAGTWRVTGFAGGSVNSLLDPNVVVRYSPGPDAYPLLPHDAAIGLPTAEAISEPRTFHTR